MKVQLLISKSHTYMADKRKRLHSSMTFEEYQDFCSSTPKKPQLKPITEFPLQIPEIDLYNDNSCTQMVLPPIDEDEKEAFVPILPITKQIKKRMRFHSDNIQYTFINFMERGIQRKKSLRFDGRI